MNALLYALLSKVDDETLATVIRAMPDDDLVTIVRRGVAEEITDPKPKPNRSNGSTPKPKRKSNGKPKRRRQSKPAPQPPEAPATGTPADEDRRAILGHIMANDGVQFTGIVEHVGRSGSTVMRHLNALLEEGLVEQRGTPRSPNARWHAA